jgi:hypothetical protein
MPNGRRPLTLLIVGRIDPDSAQLLKAHLEAKFRGTAIVFAPGAEQAPQQVVEVVEVLKPDFSERLAEMCKRVFIPRSTGNDNQPFYAGLYRQRKGSPRNLRPKTH